MAVYYRGLVCVSPLQVPNFEGVFFLASKVDSVVGPCFSPTPDDDLIMTSPRANQWRASPDAAIRFFHQTMTSPRANQMRASPDAVVGKNALFGLKRQPPKSQPISCVLHQTRLFHSDDVTESQSGASFTRRGSPLLPPDDDLIQMRASPDAVVGKSALFGLKRQPPRSQPISCVLHQTRQSASFTRR